MGAPVTQALLLITMTIGTVLGGDKLTLKTLDNHLTSGHLHKQFLEYGTDGKLRLSCWIGTEKFGVIVSRVNIINDDGYHNLEVAYKNSFGLLKYVSFELHNPSNSEDN